ncbi:MAG: DUF87 domain-containing protein [Candidatus Omnitrophica bacterium]|nr:DUF87 domain-containing protein [Candidatus Omnitrophota bacterium]
MMRPGFPSLINYFGFIREGVMLNKDASFSAAFFYSGPDMDCACDEEKQGLAAYVNGVLTRLSTGWTINVDAMRVPAKAYPRQQDFQSPLLRLIEDRRRNMYEKEGAHYENEFCLTLTYRPTLTDNRNFRGVFGEEKRGDATSDLRDRLTRFEKEIQATAAGLAERLTIRRMSSQEMMDFFGFCVTGARLRRPLLSPPAHLHYYFGGYDFTAGFTPRVDNLFVAAVGIVGFPFESVSGILRSLNDLPFEYRFSHRFIILDHNESVAVLKKIRRGYHNQQMDLTSALSEITSSSTQIAQYKDGEALAKAKDADSALNEAREGTIKYGYYTGVVILFDPDIDQLADRAQIIRKTLDSHGFPARVEKGNAVEAYLGSLPGHQDVNVRQPLISTMNLAHIVPLTSVWPGLNHNPCPFFPKEAPPLFYGKTVGATPYRFNLHVSDVGHAMVLGPTGSGKSTLLALIAASFFRYANSQVFIFDKGNSQNALVRASGGEHHNILSGGEGLAFCPLAGIQDDQEKLWAGDWIEILLWLQGVGINPKIRNDIHEGLDALSATAVKTLSNFYTTVQNKMIKEALQPFVDITHGVMSGLLDAAQDGLSVSDFQVFEMEHLLNKDERYTVPVLTYLFHKIEQRLTGRPTLIILDEAWLLLKHKEFSHKIEEWLRVLRKANASVVFSTNSLADVIHSPIKHVLDESCPTKIFLPNPIAATPNIKEIYLSFGLTEEQIKVITYAVPKKHYYHTSPLGTRLFELGLGPVELSFMFSAKDLLKDVNELEQEQGKAWTYFWLKRRGLNQEAEEWKNYAQLS